MQVQGELWILLYVLSAVIVLLLAVSTGFSLGGCLLRPLFDKADRLLHVLPPEQYLAFFAQFVATGIVLSVITGLGVSWLIFGGLASFLGATVLLIGAAGYIYTGLLAVRQLVDARQSDPVERARHDNPSTMRFASAELIRGIAAIDVDVPVVDVQRLRSRFDKFCSHHDRLHGELNQVRRREAGRHLVAWSRELAPGYTRLVRSAAVSAVILAVVGSGTAVAARESLLRSVLAGAVLALSAVGLWWSGMWLRAKTHAGRMGALSEQLTAELSHARRKLDDIDRRIRKESGHPAHEGGPVETRTPKQRLFWPIVLRSWRDLRHFLGRLWAR